MFCLKLLFQRKQLSRFFLENRCSRIRKFCKKLLEIWLKSFKNSFLIKFQTSSNLYYNKNSTKKFALLKANSFTETFDRYYFFIFSKTFLNDCFSANEELMLSCFSANEELMLSKSNI